MKKRHNFGLRFPRLFAETCSDYDKYHFHFEIGPKFRQSYERGLSGESLTFYNLRTSGNRREPQETK